jgi:hypothetical protein
VKGEQKVRSDLFNALSKVMYLKKLHVESKDEFLDRAAAQLEAVYTQSAEHKVYVDYHRKQYGSRARMGETQLRICKTFVVFFPVIPQ